MRPLVSAAEMRAAEKEAATRGLSAQGLMQLAAQGAAGALLQQPDGAQGKYLVLAGPGNNGGDALVLAGLLKRAGAQVEIVTYRRSHPSEVDPEGITRFEATADRDGVRLREVLLRCDVVIDGVLGTGRARPLEADLVSTFSTIRHAPSHPRIVALDLPSGVDADSGAADEATLSADQTLTFGYVKRGLLQQPARGQCGEIRLIAIGLPDPPRVPIAAYAPEHADVAGWLPRRATTIQKYSAGAVLAIAGGAEYVGAPILSSTAALRAGAGYVTLATTQSTVRILAARVIEQTMLPLAEPGENGLLPPEAFQRLQEVTARYGALLIGPGLGRERYAIDLVLRVLEGALRGPTPAVVDADALFALAERPEKAAGLALPVVLTPHTGEMARLTGLKSAEIEANRYAVALEWSHKWKQVVVLKGPATVVAAPDGRLSVNTTGNQLLATAGTGDVLSGVIAALLAGGTEPFDAARAGVYLHGLAADIAAPIYGDRGMVAGDLLSLLPEAIKRVQGAMPVKERL